MSDHEKALLKILAESGTIGKLRQKIIALLLMVEDLGTTFEDENDEEFKNAQNLIEKLELLLHEFSTSQKIADKILTDLSPEKRMVIQKEAPELFDIFGWHDKVGENGDINDIDP
jgi:hypothetical protein